MKDNETLIFEIRDEIKKLENAVLAISQQIEIAKAERIENHKFYSPLWMAKATGAMKAKNIRITRLRKDLSIIEKEQAEILSNLRYEADKKKFVPALKKLMIDEFGKEKTADLFHRAGEMANEENYELLS
jgi:hypothetical protein